MFKKIIVNALKSLSPDEKQEVRKALAEQPAVEQEVDTKDTNEVTETAENVGEQRENIVKKGETEMEKDQTTTTTEETTKATETEGKKGEETTEVKDAKSTEEVANTKTAEPQVTDAPTTGNGVRIEDLVTKDEVQALMASFEAKFAAVVKENQDLKAKNEELVAKYETPNFGGQARQGVAPQDKSVKAANQSYDEYVKNFM